MISFLLQRVNEVLYLIVLRNVCELLKKQRRKKRMEEILEILSLVFFVSPR